MKLVVKMTSDAREFCACVHTHTHMQTDRQADRQRDRQTGRLTKNSFFVGPGCCDMFRTIFISSESCVLSALLMSSFSPGPWHISWAVLGWRARLMPRAITSGSTSSSGHSRIIFITCMLGVRDDMRICMGKASSLASFPGPAQLPATVVCNENLGRTWEHSYNKAPRAIS